MSLFIAWMLCAPAWGQSIALQERSVQLAAFAPESPPIVSPATPPVVATPPAVATAAPEPPPLDPPPPAATAPQRGSIFKTLGDRWLDAEDPEIAIAASQASMTTFENKPGEAPKPKKWYEKLGVRGYTQMRINETVTTDAGSAPAQHVGDRSVGANQEFLLRRVRLIIFGDVSDYMYVYLQPDFAITPPGSTDATNFAQIRDWYADIYLTKDKVHRIRAGQSKVPYGWENMQSSSNRIPLDRTDALNSAVRNERDLGVFYYWTPEYAQDFFKDVLDKGLKGSGNYGMFGLGCYNGQGGSLLEQNDRLHIVARATLPFQLPNCQYVELGMQGYTGDYVVLSSPISPLGVGAPVRPANTLENGGPPGLLDQRLAWSAIWYPQPIGLQAEWNVGRGPGLNDAQTAVEVRSLYGGYVMATCKYDTDCWGTHFPFVRYAYYKGGYKPERNAPFSRIAEWEIGWEWQFNPQVELCSTYTLTDRTNTTAMGTAGAVSYRQFEGDLARFQLQFNY